MPCFRYSNETCIHLCVSSCRTTFTLWLLTSDLYFSHHFELYEKQSKSISSWDFRATCAKLFLHELWTNTVKLSGRFSFKAKHYFLIIHWTLQFHANYSSASKSYMQSDTFMAFGKYVEGYSKYHWKQYYSNWPKGGAIRSVWKLKL